MQIIALEVINFKVIRHLQLESIPQLVVIAGPNGSGKTALFDALRLFKEAIGSYSLGRDKSSQSARILQQIGPAITLGEQQATITVSIRLSTRERRILAVPDEHPGILTESIRIWRTSVGSEEVSPTYPLSSADRGFFHRLFTETYLTGGELGIVDHIGADRQIAYGTDIHGLTFSFSRAEEELQNLVLTSENKFNNLAQDIITMRFLDMQERERGVDNPRNYIRGIRDVFQHFLPDKEFLDIELPHGLSSPPRILVRSGGIEHDISQLSSGEREILMTYTHLEKLRPTGSIILFDEPELHLHPALQRRVIAHLQKLIERGSNQIWVITHAEELVNATEFESLFAMTGRGASAALPVRDRAARIGLLEHLGAGVGLQLTSPRILFLEGESDAELLPLFFKTLPVGISLVNTSGKGSLMRLTETAMRLLEETIKDGQFFLVRDLDVEDDPSVLDMLQNRYEGHFFVWDRYHIENYLLDSEAIYHYLVDEPDIKFTPVSVQDVSRELRIIADERRDSVLAKHIEARLNRSIRRRIVLNVKDGLMLSLAKAAEAYRERTARTLEVTMVEQLYNEVNAELIAKWDAEWKALCIGRDVLKEYHANHLGKYIGYEVFRNKIARTIREMDRVPRAILDLMKSMTEGLPPSQGGNEAR